MKTLLINKTGFDIEFEVDAQTVTLQDGAEIELKAVPSRKDIIVYGDVNETHISDGYTMHDGTRIQEIYCSK